MHNERLRTNLTLDSVSDIDTWERAVDAHALLSKTYYRAGLPPRAPLVIPEAVLIAIAQRQAERTERLAQREGQAGRGSRGPAGTVASESAGSSGGGSSLESGRKKRNEDDDGSAPPVPPGRPEALSEASDE